MSLDYPNRQDWIYVRETRKQPRKARLVHNSEQGAFRTPFDFPLVRPGLGRRVANRPGVIAVASGESRPKNPKPPGYSADGTKKSAAYYAAIRAQLDKHERRTA